MNIVNLSEEIIKSAKDFDTEHHKSTLFKYMFDKGMVQTLRDLADICKKEVVLLEQAEKESAIKNKNVDDIKKLKESGDILDKAAVDVFKTGLV